MSLDDGTTHRQPHPHAMGFGGMKGFKYFFQLKLRNTGTTILHGQLNFIVTRNVGFNYNPALAWFDDVHRLNGIACQIENHLLNQDTIHVNRRKRLPQQQFDFSVMPARLDAD